MIYIVPAIKSQYKKQYEISLDIKLIEFLKKFYNKDVRVLTEISNLNKNCKLLVISGGNTIPKISKKEKDQIRSKFDCHYFNQAINNKIPAQQFYAVAVPDFINLEYSCLIQTYYMEQLNKIIESCEYASDAYWGNPERFKFRAFIDSFSTETSLTNGKDRLVKGTFNIRLRGYIIPDTVQKDMNSISKYNSKSKFIISMETTSNSEIFQEGVNKTKDGRTRRQREDQGEISNISDVTPGTELKN